MCDICNLQKPATPGARETWAEARDRLTSLILAHRVSALVDDGDGITPLGELNSLARLVAAELPGQTRSLVLAVAVDLLARVQQHAPGLRRALPEIQHGPYIRLADQAGDNPVTHDILNAARLIRAAINTDCPPAAVADVAGSQALDVLAHAVRRAYTNRPQAEITVAAIGGITGQIHTALLTLLAERLTDTDLYAGGTK